MLVLREREAALRQRLMDHWSGVLAWEVRRLERTSSEAHARYSRQQRQVNVYRDREDAIRRQFSALEEDLQVKTHQIKDLEGAVDEMTRREQAVKDEVGQLDEERGILEKERQGWRSDRQTFDQERDRWQRERQAFDDERRNWKTEKRNLVAQREEAIKDRQKALESGQMSNQDRITMNRIRSDLGSILNRKSGTVGEAEVVDAMEEVKRLVSRMEGDIARLKDEMHELNNGLEEEVRRTAKDRDQWKSKAEKAEVTGAAEFEKRLRAS